MASKPPANAADTTTDPKAKASDTKEYTVAPGRTVTADKDYGPEQKVTLPTDEGTRLQALGFLRQDDGSILGQADEGPKTAQGVEIKEA